MYLSLNIFDKYWYKYIYLPKFWEYFFIHLFQNVQIIFKYIWEISLIIIIIYYLSRCIVASSHIISITIIWSRSKYIITIIWYIISLHVPKKASNGHISITMKSYNKLILFYGPDLLSAGIWIDKYPLKYFSVEKVSEKLQKNASLW